MLEVFMLGVLITIVKMVSLARVIPETALFAFGALTLMFTVVVTFDSRTLWDIADALRAGARQARRPAGSAGHGGHEIDPDGLSDPGVPPTLGGPQASSAASPATDHPVGEPEIRDPSAPKPAGPATPGWKPR
jgi:paraquat-inducible protein A